MKKSINILLSRLEANRISKHVVCPSACFVIGDLSCKIPNAIEIIDERSACYVATGICEEANQPVVVWCADNDSYRNLTPALTEAFYKKLPILVVALSLDETINQTINPYDTIRYYVNTPSIGGNGLDADIDIALCYLSAEVMGPVYMSLKPYKKNETISYNESVQVNTIDVNAILNIIPLGACVHVGKNVRVDSSDNYELVHRNDHCTMDGNVSMLIGSSIVARGQLHIGIFTHDEIVYDLNMFGNRHVDNNIILISVSSDEHVSAVFDFANRMAWDCRRIRIEELSAIKDCFVISDKPKYIEVAL